MLSNDEFKQVIHDAIYNAWINALSVTGPYPITCEEILKVMKDAIKEAAEEKLSEQDLLE